MARLDFGGNGDEGVSQIHTVCRRHGELSSCASSWLTILPGSDRVVASESGNAKCATPDAVGLVCRGNLRKRGRMSAP
jgi:hypothetical protein